MYAVNSGSNPVSDLRFIPQYFSLSLWQLSPHKAIAWSSRIPYLNTTIFRELFEYNWILNVVFFDCIVSQRNSFMKGTKLVAIISDAASTVKFPLHLGSFQGSYRVLNSWNLPINFPDLKKVLKIEVKSEKLVTSLEFCFFFFFKATASA